MPKSVSCPKLIFYLSQVSKDDRSDIESSSDEEEVAPPSHKHHTNGTNGAHGSNGFLCSSLCPDEH